MSVPKDDVARVERIAKLMSKHRLSKVRVGALELEMSPLGFSIPEVEQGRVTQPIGEKEGGYPTEEQLLMWSAGGPLPEAAAGGEPKEET